MTSETYRPGRVAGFSLPRELPEEARGFQSLDELFEMAARMLVLRHDPHLEAARRALDRKLGIGDGGDQPPLQPAEQERLSFTWAEHFHRCFELTGDEIPLVRTFRAAALSTLEREIALALILSKLGFLGNVKVFAHAIDVLQYLGVPPMQLLEGLRCFAPGSRLQNAKIVTLDDEQDSGEVLPQRAPVIDPQFLDDLVLPEGCTDSGWDVSDEESFHDRLTWVGRVMVRKITVYQDHLRGSAYARRYQVNGAFLALARLMGGLDRTLARHPEYGLARLFKAVPEGLDGTERTILCALTIKELRALDATSELFTGWGLIASSCGNFERAGARYLRSSSRLIERGYVQPCGGPEELLRDDPEMIRHTEFELGPKSLELLGLQRLGGKHDLCLARPAAVRLEQLVLGDEIERSLRMALAQAKYAKVLLEDWGLGEKLAYGRGLTILFSGPPGVGKTASAEALAAELGLPIVVANYSKILGCYVGQTEKSISRLFQQAKQHQALLFWDEVDAMLTSREEADRQYEVRQVNVLLQEMERFEGVCVLATNRVSNLDPALERRIAMKVQFEPPDRDMRRRIFEKLLPAKLPLEPEVSLEALCEPALSGGEIKNVVLNAARLALMRGPDTRVSLDDFQKAIAMETDNRWTKGSSIGFGQERG